MADEQNAAQSMMASLFDIELEDAFDFRDHEKMMAQVNEKMRARFEQIKQEQEEQLRTRKKSAKTLAKEEKKQAFLFSFNILLY